MMKFIPSLLPLLAAIVLVIGCDSGDNQPTPVPLSDSPIDWQSWGKSAFADAKANDKLVFLYLETFWCEPCLKMKQNTFTDPAIIQLLSDNFVSIYADSDRGPGLFERYQLGTYPSCVILTSSAGMIGGSNALPPDSLEVLLTRIVEVKESRPEALEEQSSRLEQSFREDADKIIPSQPSEEVVTNAERAVLSLYDSLYYGFGDQPKYPIPEALEFMLSAVSPEGLAFKSELKNTLDAQLALYDSVWGGFGRSARFADWSEVNHEKLLDLNADLALLYLDACQIMDDSTYCDIAEGTLTYIDRFLGNGQGWGYYNSQRGVLPLAMENYLSAGAYFSLPDAERQMNGVPAIDTTIYAGSTGKAASAFLRIGRALDRNDWADYALSTLDTLLTHFVSQNGAVRHQLSPAIDERGGLLPDQVAVAGAFIDAYETTGDAHYLEAAELLARFIVNELEDMRLGGFMFEPPITDAVGREQVRIKPYIPNAEAIWLFTRLYYLTGHKKYQRPAESTLRFVVARPVNKVDIKLPYLAMAYLNLTRYPSLIAMIGERNEDYNQLVAELWQEYYPRQIVVHLGKADQQQTHGQLTFPRSNRPQMFACGFDTLSNAIFQPENVHDQVSRFLRLYQISR